MRKRKKKPAVIAATVLAVLLLAGLGVGIAVIANRLKTERSAALAGVQNYSASIPRNPYTSSGFSKENGRVRYSDDSWTSETGIDVSSHQGEIDWTAAAADGIDYAVIQAGYRGYTDGTLGEDAQFRANLAGAKAAGLKVGVYFFSQAVSEDEARQEAAYVLQLLDGATLDLPVFYDWENVSSASARTASVSGGTVTACAGAFCAAVKAIGYDTGVYFNQNDIYTSVDRSQLLEYPLWLAQYQSEPDFFYEFAYWQYTDSGTVAGIAGSVDLNIRFIARESAG